MKKRVRRPKGQILVILTIALPFLLGAVALSVDVMMFYANWAWLQKAADAAALAGAHFLPNNPQLVDPTAREYAQFNDVEPSEIVSISVNDDNTRVTVVLTRTVPYYFGRVLGLSDAWIRVRAVAGVENSGGGRRLRPIGVNCINPPCWEWGELVDLKYDMEGPGNWHPLDFGARGGGANDYRNEIINGCDCYIEVGDWVDVEPGTMTGPTRTAFNTLIDQANSDPTYSTQTYESATPGNPRIIPVPLVDFNEVQGKMKVLVTGIAEFWVEEVHGRTGHVRGRFMQMVTPQQIADANAPDGGAKVPKLLE
jgi:hypothetical protein